MIQIFLISLFGLTTPETQHFNAGLLGLWESYDQRIQVMAHESISGAYDIYYVKKDLPPRRFVGRTFSLHEQLILDLLPVTDKPDPHVLAGHSFHRLRLDGETLHVDMLNVGWVYRIARDSDAVRIARTHDKLVLTSPTEQLQAFFKAYGMEEDFWASDKTLRQHDTAALLKIGEFAPEFRVSDQAGVVHRLSEYKDDKNVVLIFYPGDDTPGCTKQLCAVRDDYSQFQATDVAFFGVNPQSAKSHRKFIEKYDLPFPLLVDSERQLMSHYGCQGKRWTQRTVYGIDKTGRIVFAQRGMPSNEEILQAFATD